jgi:hypothetical protein
MDPLFCLLCWCVVLGVSVLSYVVAVLSVLSYAVAVFCGLSCFV